MAAGNVNAGLDYPNVGYDGLPKQMARARESGAKRGSVFSAQPPLR